MKRKPLSKKEIKELNTKLTEINFQFDKKDRIDLIDNQYYFKDGEILFFIVDDQIIPTLKFLLKNEVEMPTAIVDMGSIKFIANGADVMRPGIKEFIGDIKEGTIIKIIDENNKRPIVIGKAVSDLETLKAQETGKSLTNIHYIGDELWNFEI